MISYLRPGLYTIRTCLMLITSYLRPGLYTIRTCLMLITSYLRPGLYTIRTCLMLITSYLRPGLYTIRTCLMLIISYLRPGLYTVRTFHTYGQVCILYGHFILTSRSVYNTDVFDFSGLGQIHNNVSKICGRVGNVTGDVISVCHICFSVWPVRAEGYFIWCYS